MGLINADSIKGLASQLLGFGKTAYAKMANLTYPYVEGFIKSSDVYAVVNKIAKNGAAMPWILKLELNNKVETITSGDLYNTIQQPNEQQNRLSFVNMALTFLLLSGEVFQRTINSEILKEIVAVDLLNPQITTINTVKRGYKYFPKNYQLDGLRDPIPVEEVEHLKYSNPTLYGEHSLRGLPPLVAGGLTLQGLTNNQEANASILENQGAAGILSNENVESVLTDPERTQAQKMLDGILSGFKKFGKVIQGATKLRFIRLGLDPTQLKIIESKIMMFRDLCAVYDTKSILFNDPQNASFRNLETAEKSHYLCAVIPNVNLIIGMFTDGVVKKFNEKEFPNGNGRYFIELDLSSIEVLQADQKLEAQKDKIKMEGVKLILEMPISSPAKVQLLIEDYGYSEEIASVIVNPTGKINEGIELLNSVSALVANGLLGRMSDEQIQNLFK